MAGQSSYFFLAIKISDRVCFVFLLTSETNKKRIALSLPSGFWDLGQFLGDYYEERDHILVVSKKDLFDELS